MSNPTTSTPSTPPHPLAQFQKIGHNTSLYTPPPYTPSQPLILFFSWNAAAAKHIAKYTLGYQGLFPTARILLIRCFTADIFRLASAHQRLVPALEVVHEHVKAGGEVLVHSSSNGGGTQVVEFAKAWRKMYGGERMPMRAQIIDSAPGMGV
ncbi:hypothetical protein CC80DRAFT_488139 [Byssothecium circinans]|uniref:DUF829-domain-containing protein n=1 Tax=Byssothecium circinans TaxID=147558 RepID=A0A6A5UFK8_9PLEO|nr:hypothetical protein CC80DRAFT_488139 [Byssothecium circinans]